MARAIIAHARLFDLATLSAAAGAWRETQTVSLANLQNMQPGLKARTTDASTNTYFVIDFTSAGGAVAVNLVALIATNLSASATIRIRGATSEANLTAAPGYDSGSISAWPTSGRPTDEGLTAWTVLKKLSNTTAYVWWRIDFSDASNADGYLEFGRAIPAPIAFNPAINFQYDWGANHAPADVVIRSPFGPTKTQKRLDVRSFDLPFGFLTEAEMWTQLAQLRRLRGLASDVVVCLDHEATDYLHHYTIHGLLGAPIEIRNPDFSIFAARVPITELV